MSMRTHARRHKWAHMHTCAHNQTRARTHTCTQYCNRAFPCHAHNRTEACMHVCTMHDHSLAIFARTSIHAYMRSINTRAHRWKCTTDGSTTCKRYMYDLTGPTARGDHSEASDATSSPSSAAHVHAQLHVGRSHMCNIPVPSESALGCSLTGRGRSQKSCAEFASPSHIGVPSMPSRRSPGVPEEQGNDTCVRACMRACVHAYMRKCMRKRIRMSVLMRGGGVLARHRTIGEMG